MEQVLQHGGIADGNEPFAADVRVDSDEELGFAVGLRFAVPLGFAIWALAIWGAIHLLT
jgi:hypothetical protein